VEQPQNLLLLPFAIRKTISLPHLGHFLLALLSCATCLRSVLREDRLFKGLDVFDTAMSVGDVRGHFALEGSLTSKSNNRVNRLCQNTRDRL